MKVMKVVKVVKSGQKWSEYFKVVIIHDSVSIQTLSMPSDAGLSPLHALLVLKAFDFVVASSDPCPTCRMLSSPLSSSGVKGIKGYPFEDDVKALS